MLTLPLPHLKRTLRLARAATCTLLFASTAISSYAVAGSQDEPRLEELSWIDKKYFEKQRTLIDDLGRENYGTRIRGNIMDLGVLQRILDGQHIGIYDDHEQKALGIVLGDIYVAEHGWHWREYNDSQGRSRGVCLVDTSHCVFPLSMMTRRLRVTHEIDIEKVYNRGLELMADVMPATPYQVEPEKVKPADPLKGKKLTPFF